MNILFHHYPWELSTLEGNEDNTQLEHEAWNTNTGCYKRESVIKKERDKKEGWEYN